MYAIKNKRNGDQAGYYTTPKAAQRALDLGYAIIDTVEGLDRIKLDSPDGYEIVKKATPEMVALEEAKELLRRCDKALAALGSGLLQYEVGDWLSKH